jgi:O-antigen/teichoic acid export membrane protein
MKPRATDALDGDVLASGHHERRLATNYLARQGSQLAGMVVGLGVTTVLARHLPLSVFGLYALLLSLTSYLIFVQAIVETSAIKAIAEARDEAARDRAFSTALLVYSASGIVAGGLVAGLGAILLHVWTIPSYLRDDARQGVAALSVVMFLAWPTRAFYDALRGAQLFTLVAAAEVISLAFSSALLVAFVLVDAPLWLIVSAAASGSLVTGLSSAAIIASKKLPYRFTRAGLSRAGTRQFLRLSGYFFLAGVADFVIYSLDRTILGAFRSARSVGLYEGPIRAHNLVRDVQAVAVSPVLPAAARYEADADESRLHDLLVRGTRYMLAVITPLAVVLMVLARPLLVSWLGPKFAPADVAMAILVGYWVVYANTAVGWNMLVARGQIRTFAFFAASIAVVNAALSLALTPIWGLNGVVLGTAIPYVLGVPVFLRLALPQFGVSIREFAREVWLPAYSTAAVVAVGLVAVRLSFDLATIPASLAAASAGVASYWLIYYFIWLRPNERLLLRDLARQLAPLSKRAPD